MAVAAADQACPVLVVVVVDQATLHSQVLEAVAVMLATLLSHVERNAGLKLLASSSSSTPSGSELTELWYHLLDVSFREMRVSPDTAAVSSSAAATRVAGRCVSDGHFLKPMHRLEVPDTGRAMTATSTACVCRARGWCRRRYDEVRVSDDGASGPFECRFPFSFFLYRLVDAMRPVAEGATEESLSQQLDLLSLGRDLAGRLGPDLLSRYMHDVTCMRFGAVQGLGRDEQAKLLARVLELAADTTTSPGSAGPPTTIAAVHHRLWKTER